MYRFVLLLVIGFLSVNLYAQSPPPGKVKKALSGKYENAEIIKWESEGDRIKVWKALFKHEGVLSSSTFDHKGNWLETKTKISIDEIPEAVLKSIDEDYASYKIVIAARFENPETEGYEVFLDNETYGFDVQYSSEGKLIKRKLNSAGYKPIDDDGKVIEE